MRLGDGGGGGGGGSRFRSAWEVSSAHFSLVDKAVIFFFFFFNRPESEKEKKGALVKKSCKFRANLKCKQQLPVTESVLLLLVLHSTE